MWVDVDDDYVDDLSEIVEIAVAQELARYGQITPEYANSIAECTDTTKLYVLPDGYIYAYFLTETVVGGTANYKNQIPLSVNTDGSAYVGANGEDGYKTGYRLNSSGAEQAQSGMCCTGFIPVKAGDKVRIKNVTLVGTKSPYLLFYNASGTCLTTLTQYPENTSTDSDGVHTYTVGSGNAELKYMRLSAGVIDDTTIITVNEEIKETSDTVVTDYAWASTGHAFVSADYEDRIIALENKVNIAGGDQIELIRNWNAPIYDDAPVFLMSQDKPAMGTQTVAAVYEKYDALMAAYPNYITKTDLGLASDGKTHIYRYDFCEPRTRKNPESSNHPDLVKPKAIIVSGIHLEYAGIYGLYYALEEIATNAELHHDLRNNTHLIVVPCMNPYCLDSANYNASNGRKNANGVEIHRNFEVDHTVVDVSSNNYGGATPLSEVESQYVDAIMAENPDAAFFLTCHNFDSDTYFGSGFIWPSVATRYMYNMGSRLIDKMSKSWLDKYGDTFRNGVDAVKTSSVAAGDYTVGMVGISGSPGTETKQAMKYGIQGTNVEIAKMFKVFNSTVGSKEVMSRGAEVYVNFLRMAFGCYDHKDKKLY